MISLADYSTTRKRAYKEDHEGAISFLSVDRSINILSKIFMLQSVTSWLKFEISFR